MTEPCAPINEGIYKKKKPLTFRDFLVDLEGIHYIVFIYLKIKTFRK